LNAEANSRIADAAAHKSANAAFLTDYTNAQAAVASLTTASAGADQTSTKQAVLTPLVAATDAAELAVATQRGRVENLYEAKRTQDAEQAAWGVRVAASSTAKDTADAAKLVADAAVTAE